MINNQDRSGWFGASDTHIIMGNWNTKTFQFFWLEKLGIIHRKIVTPAMLAGTYYEHRILEYIGVAKMDRQIKIPKLRLRVNLDGETKNLIHEVKTYSKDKFNVPKSYWQQCQVQQWAAKKPCVIDAYRLYPEDYNNYFNPIDEERLSEHPIPYDAGWVENEYLPRLEYLAYCLKKKVTP